MTFKEKCFCQLQIILKPLFVKVLKITFETFPARCLNKIGKTPEWEITNHAQML